MATPETHRAGTIAILGAPNVGKSTLLNRIVGEKLAIVSPKPQTTRNRIVGVWNGPTAQIVFVDTPGVHAPKSGIGKLLVSEAMRAVEDVDAGLLVVEPPRGAPSASGLPAAATPVGAVDRKILERLGERKKPVVLALNKVDTVKDKLAILPALETWQHVWSFSAMVPISAQKGTGVEDLVRELTLVVPEGPPLYGPEMLTDRSERFLAAELIREQLFLKLHQELPYSTAVVVDSWQERGERGDVVIDASILVERESQKAIVIGRGGAMIRELGTRAREEITSFLGRPAHLRLQVRVAPDWTESREARSLLGIES